ncbi:MAG: tyrosine--tRNA ligase [Myxococcota bacterium]
MNASDQLQELRRGTVDCHVDEELIDRLRDGGSLRVKAGFDPTRPDLHLGHTVLMNKLRQFQDFGHRVVFIVGDFTARIGDPTGRSQTRPTPSLEEIAEGARTYAEQAFKVLDEERTEIVYNASWLDKMQFSDVVRLAGKYTLARMMERDDFKRRAEKHLPISLHELLYPLAQGYDSIAVACDVELGGTDQLFNLLVGRDLMRESGLKPQVVMTTPLLEGLNARVEEGRIVGDKMSKSLDNYVGVSESASQQFGKLMSISDPLMWRYYDLLSTLSSREIQARRADCASGQLHPKAAKVALAKEIVSRYHDHRVSEDAHRRWEAQFAQRQVPEDLLEHSVIAQEQGSIWLPKALVSAGVTSSTSDARRRIKQGAVEVDGTRVTSMDAVLQSGGRYVVKAGKRAWVAITVESQSD